MLQQKVQLAGRKPCCTPSRHWRPGLTSLPSRRALTAPAHKNNTHFNPAPCNGAPANLHAACQPNIRTCNALRRRAASAQASSGNSRDRIISDHLLQVAIVGGDPVGLATAVALARQVGCHVEVHDAGPDPREDEHSDSSNTLVALGKRGLQALIDLGLDSSQIGETPPASLVSNPDDSGSIGGVWQPGSANLGVLTSPPPALPGQPDVQGTAAQPAAMQAQPDPLSGLTMIQGMAVQGPQGPRRELYGRSTGRMRPGATAAAQQTAGIVAIDEVSLKMHLLSAVEAANASIQQQHTTASATPLPLGPTTAPSAEAAQEAAMPPTVPAPGTTAAAAAPSGATTAATSGLSGGVQVHYNSQLMLVDSVNKQATFMGPAGQAQVVSYDLLIGADASGPAHLIYSALEGLQERSSAHKHPGHAGQQHLAASLHGAAPAELEYLCWHDMPHQHELNDLLPAGMAAAAVVGDGLKASSTGHPTEGPQRGWLLVWSGHGGQLPVSPGFRSTPAYDASLIPGAPSCTVMAWPSRTGGTWSGCVYTYPQVFEALRSQSDLEQLLRSLAFSGGGSMNTVRGLPALWVSGIAEQLRRTRRLGRVLAATVPPPPHLADPTEGILMLSPAAVAAHNPQLLQPGVSWGLAEAARLVAATVDAMSVTGSADTQRKALSMVLQQFDQQFQRQAAAQHKLSAQLSWLRHPFSPASSAAAASIGPASLAWFVGALAGAPRLGLALQWRCLLTVLPMLAAAQRTLVHTLGLGRTDTAPAGTSAPDASYRQPKKPSPAGIESSSSLDSGVHLDSSTRAAGAAALRGADPTTAAAAAAVAAAATTVAYSLPDVLDVVEPCGASLLSFVHTTDVTPSGLWRLLQLAPLLVSLLWGALAWMTVQALHWGLWAFKAWGWARSAVA